MFWVGFAPQGRYYLTPSPRRAKRYDTLAKAEYWQSRITSERLQVVPFHQVFEPIN